MFMGGSPCHHGVELGATERRAPRHGPDTGATIRRHGPECGVATEWTKATDASSMGNVRINGRRQAAR